MASECTVWGGNRSASDLTFARQNLPTRATPGADDRPQAVREGGTA